MRLSNIFSYLLRKHCHSSHKACDHTKLSDTELAAEARTTNRNAQQQQSKSTHSSTKKSWTSQKKNWERFMHVYLLWKNGNTRCSLVQEACKEKDAYEWCGPLLLFSKPYKNCVCVMCCSEAWRLENEFVNFWIVFTFFSRVCVCRFCCMLVLCR